MKAELKQPYQTFFGTLANQNRIDIIEALLLGENNVSQIIQAVKLNQTTVSHNLQRLLHCGFISVTKKGKERYYTVNKTTIKPLFNLMHAHMKNYCCKVIQKEMKQ